MNIDIENNTTLNRKLTYESSSSDSSKRNIKNNQKSFIEQTNKIVKLPDLLGVYLRPNNYMDYIDNYVIIKRTMHINSDNRNTSYFRSPFNFTTYVANNQIVNNAPLIPIISNGPTRIFKPDPRFDVYLTPRIGIIIPELYKINLNKIIIPNYFTINQTIITNNDLYTNIGSYLMTYLLSNTLNINTTIFVPLPINLFITIVNFVSDVKINIIINYDPSIVVSYIYKSFIIKNIYQYSVDSDSSSKTQRVLHLNIKELNDDYDNTTEQAITTFRLFPKSIKNRFLYADTKSIKKLFDKVPVKLNKLSIQITDSYNNILQVNFLDQDIVNPSNICSCSPEYKNYACPCIYILHPLNPRYQTYMFFNFEYKYMVINEKMTDNINMFMKERQN